MSKGRFALPVTASFVALVWTAYAQNAQSPQPLQVEKIQNDLYVISGDGGNVTVLLTDEGVLLVDSKNARNHDELVAAVKALRDKPIKYVINTHVHSDCFNTGNGRGLNPTGSPTPGFYVDYASGGSVVDFPKTADAALRLDWDVVVPGHGPLTDRVGFLKWRTDVDALMNRTTTMVHDGRTLADIQEMLVGEFGWERTGAPFRSIDGMISELSR